MANTLYKFAAHVKDEVAHPMRLATDVAYGTLGSMALEAVGFENVIGSVASAPGLSADREQQLAAGLTFATLSGLERATMRSIGAVY